MTTETQTIIDLCDIARVVFECTKCKARISTPFPDERAPEANRCPACRTDWNVPRHPYQDLLVEMDRQLQENRKEGVPFKLRFEVTPPVPGR